MTAGPDASYSRWQIIRAALRARCRTEPIEELTWQARVFYTAKCIVAALLGRRRQRTWEAEELVYVAMFDRSGPYTHPDFISDLYDWTSIIVPEGLRGWTYYDYWDGNG